MPRREFLAAVGSLAAVGARSARAVVNDPLPEKGVQLNYRVLFGDSDIGRQKISIRDHDRKGHVVVAHETKLEVRVLFSVAYALDHRSTEVWEGFTLKSIRSVTLENGKKTLIKGELAADGFHIRNGQEAWVAPKNAVSSDSFWIAAAMRSASVVNARTGDSALLMKKKLPDGRWHLKAEFDHGTVEARMRFDGDFMVDAEVDSDGHGVKLIRIEA